MKRSLLGLALITSAIAADAQPMLVRDINPGTGSSFPTHLTVFGKRLVFAANDGTNGNELWTLDSMSQIAFNINPAAANGIPTTSNRSMAVVGKYIYFPADNGTAGTELYRWDGTTANAPLLAAEIAAGPIGSGVDEVVALKGKVYFDANDGAFGEELWSYDTASNTATRLSDVNTAGSSIISSITVYNDKLYFSAYSTTTGIELYSYDPTTNNTTVVLDIEPGASSSSPNNFTVINGKLYFTASTTNNGRELYMYNGTNVQRITDLVTGPSNGISFTSTGVQKIVGLNGMIYLSGDDGTSVGHLYKFDPTTGIVSLVYRTNATGSSNITNFASYGGKIYFSAFNTASGNELWMYNGTGIPTMVADIRTGVNNSNPAEFCVMEKQLYFNAFDSATGIELYKLYDSALTVKNVKFDGEVKVYPNPATATTTIDITLQQNQQLGMKLIDMSGRVVYTVPVTTYNAGSNKVSVPVAELATGTYIYTIFNEAGSMMLSGRIMKQ